VIDQNDMPNSKKLASRMKSGVVRIVVSNRRDVEFDANGLVKCVQLKIVRS
jgi:hypothetical protein